MEWFTFTLKAPVQGTSMAGPNALAKEDGKLKRTEVELKEVVEQTDKDLRMKDEKPQLQNMQVAKLDDGNMLLSNTLKEGKKEVPQLGEGPKYATEIFPEEIWKAILQEVTDPITLWNCCNACPLFDNILHQWKTGYMLEQALPHLHKHLDEGALLRCRVMSKGWYGAVNSFLEDHPSLRPHTIGGDAKRLDIVNPMIEHQFGAANSFHFYSDSGSRQFIMRDFPRVPGRNPFIGRSVSLLLRLFEDVDSDNREEWWDRVCNFLDLFGKEIWYVNLNFQFVKTNWARQMVIEFLSEKLFIQCPNLRKIRVIERDWKIEDATVVAFDPQLLPPAPKLETLASGIQNGWIFNILLRRYMPQLRKVEVPEAIWRSVWANPDMFDFSLLNEVFLNFVTVKIIKMFLREEARMPGGITKLGINFWNEGVPIRRKRFMKFIENLAVNTKLNTLQIFGDHAPCYVTQAVYAPTSCAPESLKTLELVYYRNAGPARATRIPPDSYDFLVLFPSLENLHVRFIDQKGVFRCQEECEIIVGKLGESERFVKVIKKMIKGDMYRSNVWEMLPQLKVFSFQWDVYTREGYEAFLENRVFPK